MKAIELDNGYVIRKINLSEYKNMELLCEKCSDYYILHSGSEPDKEDIKEIFLALPLKKDKKDKFVLGIYNLENRLVGVVILLKIFRLLANGCWD